jgi:heme/copper-type cytochrome/quinol oxidase subunit 3
MAPPKRKAGGRVTPKATKPGGLPSAAPGPAAPRRTTQAPSSRYTPPTPKSMKVSPPWVPVLMFGLLLLGAVMIVLNYLELLPGSVTNWYLLGGLGLILGGIFVATQYR